MQILCKYDELVSPSSLKPYPRNRNTHSKEQIERLAFLIENHGMRAPVVVSNRSKCIMKGHATTEAFKRKGWDQIPVVYQDFHSDEQEYTFVQSDNTIAAWSELDISGIHVDIGEIGPFDLDLLGIKDFRLEPIEKLEPGCDEDEVPEQVEPKTKLGDIYQLGNHHLMCGDSTMIDAVERLMNGEKADMVFTDPPYGLEIVDLSGSVGSSKPFGGVDRKVGKYSPIIGDSTIQTAIDSYNLCSGLGIKTLIFWGGNHYASALPDSSCWIVWDKETTGYFADAELAWTNQKTTVRIFKHMWNGLLKASERRSRRVHPTQKPIALAEWCFENYGNPKSVLDLFGGSGSTLIACEKTNRKCFMSEIDPHYVNVIVQRWMKYSGKMAYLIEDSSGPLKKPVPYVEMDSFRGESTQELLNV